MDTNKALKKLTNGYYILTALNPDKEYLAAGTVNWVSQVAFDPPMVGVSLGEETDLNQTIKNGGHFTLHILSDKHMDLINKFARDSEVTQDTINGVPYHKEGEEIVIEDALAFIKCELAESMPCGDHVLHTGKVVDTRINKDLQPLSTVAVPSSYSPERAETNS